MLHFVFTFAAASTPIKAEFLSNQMDSSAVRQFECGISIPTFFSHCGDGFQEFLVIKGLERYQYSSLSIYNRWGTTIYESTNYQNDWDGSLMDYKNADKEIILPEGTYFYRLILGGNPEVQCHQKEFIGYVYIKR